MGYSCLASAGAAGWYFENCLIFCVDGNEARTVYPQRLSVAESGPGGGLHGLQYSCHAVWELTAIALGGSCHGPSFVTDCQPSCCLLSTRGALLRGVARVLTQMEQIQASWRATATSEPSLAAMQRSIYRGAGTKAPAPSPASQTQPQQVRPQEVHRDPACARDGQRTHLGPLLGWTARLACRG